MQLEYKLLDKSYKPSPDVERAIQRDVQWIHGVIIQQEIGEQKPICLVDGVKFEDSVSIDGARALGYVPQARRIHYSDGAILGSYDLKKTLEELTQEELNELSREGSNTLLRLDMLQRLKELVVNQ